MPMVDQFGNPMYDQFGQLIYQQPGMGGFVPQ